LKLKLFYFEFVKEIFLLYDSLKALATREEKEIAMKLFEKLICLKSIIKPEIIDIKKNPKKLVSYYMSFMRYKYHCLNGKLTTIVQNNKLEEIIKMEEIAEILSKILNVALTKLFYTNDYRKVLDNTGLIFNLEMVIELINSLGTLEKSNSIDN